jgi:hypothetical protein
VDAIVARIRWRRTPRTEERSPGEQRQAHPDRHRERPRGCRQKPFGIGWNTPIQSVILLSLSRLPARFRMAPLKKWPGRKQMSWQKSAK